jgi:hypothetical protein
MCVSSKGELFNVYRTGRPVSMSTDTMREVQLGCQVLSATSVFVETPKGLGRDTGGRRPHESAELGRSTRRRPRP